VPHFTTLQKASRRLLRVPKARRPFTATVHRFLRRRVKRAAFDSTGLDCGHASRSSIRCRNGAPKQWQTVAYSRYAQLETSFACASHLRVGVLVGRGPRVAGDRFVPLLDDSLTRVQLEAALADAGYDSEPHHRQAREPCGVRSFIPAAIGRPTMKPPTGKYRRRRKQRLDKAYGPYGQRGQAETGFSMIKRRWTSTVNGRGYWNQCRELLLIAITSNIMLLCVFTGFLQSNSRPLISPVAHTANKGLAG
jgi:hypothetical protein